MTYCDFVETIIDTSYIFLQFLVFFCGVNWILNFPKMLLLSSRVFLDLLILLLRT